MNLKQTIRKVLSEHNKGKDKKIKDIILNATEWDDFLSALAVKYGDTVPLYHATTKETAEIIDREGFRLTYGKNYKSFTPWIMLIQVMRISLMLELIWNTLRICHMKLKMLLDITFGII